LFDTNSVIKIMFFQAEGVMTEFVKRRATPCYIDPIYAELAGTNSRKERIKRQEFIADHSFRKLPLTSKDMARAEMVQQWLSARDIFPGPMDLYIAGVLGAFSNNNILLLTSDLSHYPYPLFKREAYITLQAPRQNSILSLLSFDSALL